jgi:hypothetical protein
VRPLLATFAVSLLAFLGAGAAGSTPTKATALTPAEQKWAQPVVGLWNVMNTGLLNIVKQASAQNALILGTKQSKPLVATLLTFALCPETLAKAGTPPPRMAKIATTMKTACRHLDTGSRTFGQALTAISKGNETRGSTLIVQAVGNFKKAQSPLVSARKQLIAIGSKSIFTA